MFIRHGIRIIGFLLYAVCNAIEMAQSPLHRYKVITPINFQQHGNSDFNQTALYSVILIKLNIADIYRYRNNKYTYNIGPIEFVFTRFPATIFNNDFVSIGWINHVPRYIVFNKYPPFKLFQYIQRLHDIIEF